MKKTVYFILSVFSLASCAIETNVASKEPVDPEMNYSSYGIAGVANDKTFITQSLFSDSHANISEENIQKILNGTYKLPDNLRVAVVKLESKQFQHGYYRTNEEYLKTQQSYIDLLSDRLKTSQRVKKVSIIPDLLIAKNPAFETIREAALRTQADVVAVFTINSEVYSKKKIFSSADLIKAFATTQFILLDVRTGLIPFSTTITRDYQSQKTKTDFDNTEARNRVKREAVLLTLNEIGIQLIDFLNTKN